MQKKYAEMCATLCELQNTPSEKVMLISFLKGKLTALYTQLEKGNYSIDSDIKEQMKEYVI